MEPITIKEKIAQEALKKVLQESFGAMAKVAVDIKKGILAIGGQWHADGQDLLVREEGSSGQDVWGVNFYPFEEGERRIEYIALINIKPALGNREMEIRDTAVRSTIKGIIEKLLLGSNETLTS